MLIDIDKIVVGDRIRKDFGDIEELAEDIKENTLLNALVVTPSGNGDGTYLLIAGERRLRACKMLDYKAVPVNTVGVDDAEQALMMEISENECRKEFTKTERLEYARRLARIEAAKAKERQGTRTDMVENSPLSQDAGKTRDKVAAQLGTSSNTIAREQFIADNSDLLDPADFVDWDEGKLSTNKAYQRIKAAKAQVERERDEAREDADGYAEEIRDMQEEIAELEKQADKAYEDGYKAATRNAQPQVVTRVVESEASKKRISDLEHERDLYLSDVQKLRRRNEDMRRELDKAKDMLGMDKTLQDVRKDVQYLTSATNQYVRHYGGLTWTAASLEQVDAQSLADLRTAAINLATFANALVASLENFNG